MSHKVSGELPAYRYEADRSAEYDAIGRYYYNVATHTASTIWDQVKTVSNNGIDKARDAALSAFAMGKMSNGSIPNEGLGLGNAFGVAHIFSLPQLPSAVKGSLSSLSRLLVTPSLSNLSKTVQKTAQLANLTSHLVFAGSIFNATLMHPGVHVAALGSRSVMSVIDLGSALRDYVQAVQAKGHDAEFNGIDRSDFQTQAMKATLSSLIKIAGSVSSLAFVYFNSILGAFSLLPLTMPAATAMAVAAGCGLLAHYFDGLAGPGESYAHNLRGMLEAKQEHEEDIRAQEKARWYQKILGNRGLQDAATPLLERALANQTAAITAAINSQKKQDQDGEFSSVLKQPV